jgi:hypothetical protein
MPKSTKAEEFFYEKDGKRADAKLHQDILDGGDHEAAETVSRRVAKRAGLTDEQINKLMRKPAK